MKKLKFSVIIVVFDPADCLAHPAALPKMIDSVRSLRGDYELIVVNGSGLPNCSRTSRFLRGQVEEHPDIKLVELKRNHGCGGNFNRGARIADKDSDILVYVSGDALVVDPDTLLRIGDALHRKPKVGAVHPLSVYEDFQRCNYSRAWSSQAFRQLLQNSKYDANNLPCEPWEQIEGLLRAVTSRRCHVESPVPQLPLTFYAIRHELFRDLGGFNEEFIVCHENIDIALRALEKGWESAVLKNAFVYHRRLLFRILGSAGPDERFISEGGAKGKEAWGRLWGGRAPNEVFHELRYGKFVNKAFIQPARRLVHAIYRA